MIACLFIIVLVLINLLAAQAERRDEHIKRIEARLAAVECDSTKTKHIDNDWK